VKVRTQDFDLVVVGGGSGGYAAARTARSLGASVAIADPGPLGGLCILRGCMPSKTLIASSNAAAAVRSAAELGIHAGEPRADTAFILARKTRIVREFAEYRSEQLNGFPLFGGPVRFVAPHEVAAGDVLLRGKHVILATGSSIAPHPVPGLDETGFIDSDGALELGDLPETLIVLGGGYVATELGQYFARLGVNVTFVIRGPRLLRGEDADIGEALTAAFRDEGIAVVANAQVERAGRRGERKVIFAKQDGEVRELEADEIFYALGRVPNVAGLELERARVAYHPISGVEVGLDLRTSHPDVFAVGDVAGRFQLVHVAIYQGEVAARNAVLGTSEYADYSLQKSRTVFTEPQVAVAGDNERDLAARGQAYLAASHPFADHGKAIAVGETRGFVKILADPLDGRILGAAVAGSHGSDLIHELIVAIHYRATVFDFIKVPHLHPTMAEIWTYPAEELADRIAQTRVPAPA
jgi:pyruvate/2-oxoglutarate dehydrogenase complex dihydrolipoamide dehydrogenase (E3) component